MPDISSGQDKPDKVNEYGYSNSPENEPYGDSIIELKKEYGDNNEKQQSLHKKECYIQECV